MAKRPSKPAKKPAKRPPPRSTWNIPPTAARPPTVRGDHAIEIIARGLWQHGARVLLCRNLDKGYLYLPGGHVEFGESAAAALEREFLEETGAKVRASELLLLTEGAFQTKKRWHHELNLVFSIQAAPSPGAEPPTVRSREKDIGFEWIDLAAAVDLDIRPLAIKAWLAAGAGAAESGARAEWISELR